MITSHSPGHRGLQVTLENDRSDIVHVQLHPYGQGGVREVTEVDAAGCLEEQRLAEDLGIACDGDTVTRDGSGRVKGAVTQEWRRSNVQKLMIKSMRRWE